LTTRTLVPNGKVGWQAVNAFMSNRSPLAVWRPLKIPPYQEAKPWSNLAVCFATFFLGAGEVGEVGVAFVS
jgi:hypothetical protein